MDCDQNSTKFPLPHIISILYHHGNKVKSYIKSLACRGVVVKWYSDVVSVSFFWQSDWFRRRCLAVVLATLCECVRRSVSCAEALVINKFVLSNSNKKLLLQETSILTNVHRRWYWSILTSLKLFLEMFLYMQFELENFEQIWEKLTSHFLSLFILLL